MTQAGLLEIYVLGLTARLVLTLAWAISPGRVKYSGLHGGRMPIPTDSRGCAIFLQTSSPLS